MTPPEYSLRPATAADAEFLYELNKSTLRDYVVQTWGSWDEEFQREYFGRHFDPEKNQVIHVDGELVGVISTEQDPTRIYLSDLRIALPWQKKGIGTALIQGLLKQSEKQGLPVELQVLRVNPARRLYERLGFRPVGEMETHVRMRYSP